MIQIMIVFDRLFDFIDEFGHKMEDLLVFIF